MEEEIEEDAACVSWRNSVQMVPPDNSDEMYNGNDQAEVNSFRGDNTLEQSQQNFEQRDQHEQSQEILYCKDESVELTDHNVDHRNESHEQSYQNSDRLITTYINLEGRFQNRDQRNEREENRPVLLQSIPDPPSDWKLNNILDEIAMAVDDDQLERFKGLFRGHGPGSIGKGTLEKCNSCVKFFQLLKEREYISRDNLLYVQTFLYLMGKANLIEKMVEYCRTEGSLYFYEPQQEPGPEHRNVKFHLEGRVLRSFTSNQLQDVRNKVANILCIPPDQIRVIGVGPVSSLCITLIIPKTYVDIFQNMLEQKKQFKQLCDLNVDLIYIDEKVYDITGFDDVENDETDQQRKIMSIYDQYEEQSQLLDKIQSKMSDMQDKLDETENALNDEKRKLAESNSKVQDLKNVVSMYERMEDAIGLNTEDKVNVSQELYDLHIPDELKEPIKRLLKSNANMVKAHLKQSNKEEAIKLELDLEEKKRTVIDLQRQLDIHRYLSYRSVSEVNLLQTVRLCLKDMSLEHFEKVIDVIKTVSVKLKDEELRLLKADYDSTNCQEIKNNMKDSPNLFLIGIICMEYNKRSSEVNIEQFVSNLLKKVNRDDLLQTFEEKLEELKNTENIDTFPLTRNSTAFVHSTIFGRFDRYMNLIGSPLTHTAIDSTCTQCFRHAHKTF